jgi:hypothetical protein
MWAPVRVKSQVTDECDGQCAHLPLPGALGNHFVVQNTHVYVPIKVKVAISWKNMSRAVLDSALCIDL